MQHSTPLDSSFASARARGETIQARVEYVTNTHHVGSEPDDAIQMALTYAHASREEFLHGATAPGLIVSQARLFRAGGEAVLRGASGKLNRQTVADRVWTANSAAFRLNGSVEPFKEALDKLLLLTALTEFEPGASTTFIDAVASAVSGEDNRVEVRQELAEELENQRQKLDPNEDDSWPDEYVWTEVVQRLRDEVVAIVDKSADQSSTATLRDARLAIQTVGEVTLDIPYPIAPLGTSNSPSDLFAIPETDLEPVSPVDIHHTLRRNLPVVDDTNVPEQYGDVGVALLTIFDETIHQLRKLVSEEGIDLTAVGADELHSSLFTRVFGIDYGRGITNYESPLTSHPVENSIAGNSALRADGTNLNKLHLESFNRRGGFFAVTHPAKDKTSYEWTINPGVLNVQLSDNKVESDPLIPEAINTLEDLWWRRIRSEDARCAAAGAQCQRLRKHLVERYEDGIKGAMTLRDHLNRSVGTSVEEYLDCIDDPQLLRDAPQLESVPDGPFPASSDFIGQYYNCRPCSWGRSTDRSQDPTHQVVEEYISTPYEEKESE